jgi:hypothetical protein
MVALTGTRPERTARIRGTRTRGTRTRGTPARGRGPRAASAAGHAGATGQFAAAVSSTAVKMETWEASGSISPRIFCSVNWWTQLFQLSK